MFAAKFWNEIKEKSSKSFQLFLNTECPKRGMNTNVFLNIVCCCDLEKFFDETFGYKISIFLAGGRWQGNIKKGIKGFCNPKYKYRFVTRFFGNEDKEKIKELSIYACFQMAEKELKDKE
jgi:hypothetical protein